VIVKPPHATAAILALSAPHNEAAPTGIDCPAASQIQLVPSSASIATKWRISGLLVLSDLNLIGRLSAIQI
jgi:hypothetical protein